MIAFYDGTTDKLVGFAEEVDGSYVSESPAVSSIIANYTTKEQFEERFANWSNGYLYSVELEEGEDPESPNFLKDPVPSEPKVWTAEDVKNAQESGTDASKS
jgi:hypothetical protein